MTQAIEHQSTQSEDDREFVRRIEHSATEMSERIYITDISMHDGVKDSLSWTRPCLLHSSMALAKIQAGIN